MDSKTLRMDGACYRMMIDYGLRYLNKHRKLLNQLNVFPVPDGDTGTNMVTTLKKGYFAIEENDKDLPTVAKKFSNSVLFGARGNSGVIISQFFKGMSETFFDSHEADAELLLCALERGATAARSAVATPVEGTILTVVREAAMGARSSACTSDIDSVISSFVKHAKMSLDRTPDLLPALKEAGVVDSGGAGIVYFFEGVKKYFDGEEIDEVEEDTDTISIDYSSFGRDTAFDYGYCTELLLQLLNRKETFCVTEFKSELLKLGDSLVVTENGDKIHVHVHTKTPEEIFAFCHRFGEFLSCKIENMTVQHTETTKNILCSPAMNDGVFSVVTVAYDRAIQKLFSEMGADVSIYCEDGATPKDYIDAFECVKTDNIIVFPNSSDAILTALQAKKIYKKARVWVVSSRSLPECYAALPLLDYETTQMDVLIDTITHTISNLYIVSIKQRSESLYYAFSGKEIILIDKKPAITAIQTIEKILSAKSKEIITLFYGRDVSAETLDDIQNGLSELPFSAELFLVPTEMDDGNMILSFE